MKKKRKKDGSDKAKKSVKDGIQPQNQDNHPNEEIQGFDFGGLPARDLKKNLGCG